MSELAHNIYNTFSAAWGEGIREINTRIPVADLRSNQITLGARVGEGGVERAPHSIRLRSHPLGTYIVNLTSPYGLACPDPLPVIGNQQIIDFRDPNIDLRDKRNKSLGLICCNKSFRLLGETFGGEARLITIGYNHLELFAAQIQGLFARELSRRLNS